MNDLTEEELALIIRHAVETEHPGSGCPCNTCVELFP